MQWKKKGTEKRRKFLELKLKHFNAWIRPKTIWLRIISCVLRRKDYSKSCWKAKATWHYEIKVCIGFIHQSMQKIWLNWAKFYLNYLPVYIWGIPPINICLWRKKSPFWYCAYVLMLIDKNLTCITNSGEEVFPLCFIELFGNHHVRLWGQRHGIL